MKTIDYGVFSRNMLMILKLRKHNISLIEEDCTQYFVVNNNKKIDLTSFYNEYLNGTNLKTVSKNIESIINKEE